MGPRVRDVSMCVREAGQAWGGQQDERGLDGMPGMRVFWMVGVVMMNSSGPSML